MKAVYTFRVVLDIVRIGQQLSGLQEDDDSCIYIFLLRPLLSCLVVAGFVRSPHLAGSPTRQYFGFCAVY